MLGKRNLLGLGVALSLGTIAPASAANIQVFLDDYAGWQSAAGGPVLLEDFSDATLIPGLTITFGSEIGNIADGVYHERADDGQATKPLISFSPGLTAFGADWDMSPLGAGTGIKLVITFADTSTQTILPEIPASYTGQFYGIVSDTLFTSVRLDEGSGNDIYETFDMDNAVFVDPPPPPPSNDPQPVPEPATLALFGLGLAGLGVARRRRRAA